MVTGELEFLMEIAVSYAIQTCSGLMSAQKLQCLQYLTQMLVYKGYCTSCRELYL